MRGHALHTRADARSETASAVHACFHSEQAVRSSCFPERGFSSHSLHSFEEGEAVYRGPGRAGLLLVCGRGFVSASGDVNNVSPADS
jgi:hypothetical protein